MLTYADRYAHARDYYGMTVEEWERSEGLPPFTVAPHARSARSPGEDGWFMYADRDAAIEEEDRQMVCLRALGFTLITIVNLYRSNMSRVHKRVAHVDMTIMEAA